MPGYKNSWWKGSLDYDSTEPSQYQQVLDQNKGQNLQGLPQKPINVGDYGKLQFHSNQELQDLASQYASNTPGEYNPPTEYVEVDPNQASEIAQVYDDLEHNPNDPQVQESYNAFKQETMDQYNQLVDAGYTFEFYPDDGTDPYPNSPREAVMDVYQNKHIYVYPTESGFGSGNEEYPDHPLLEYVPGLEWNGTKVTFNDVFRAVHDLYGHAKEGLGFRSTGEDTAYRSHSSMYSPTARGAMAAETRGQNSWVNYHPEYGEHNRNAKTEDTVFAPQKATILPEQYQDPDIHWRNQVQSNWWKQSDPYFDDDNYLQFNPGEENWFNGETDEADYRVGDYVQTPSGGGVIDEVDYPKYTVHLDSGEREDFQAADISPSINPEHENPEDEAIDPQRFIGDDPEAQNFEDPTFNNYNFSESLDDINPELKVGDWVHVFNPDPENEDYIDNQGEVSESNGELYTVDFGGNTSKFHRDEIELVGRQDDTVTSWFKGSAPIRFSPEDVQPGEEGFSVPWGATQKEDGSYSPSTPDRDKKNPNKLKKDNTPSVSADDLKRMGMTPEIMVDNIKRAFYAADEQTVNDGAGWYDVAQASAQKVVDEVGGAVTLEQVVGIQSAISPMLSWEQNERYPSIIIDEYMNQGMTDTMQWRDTKLDSKTGIRLKLSIIPANREKSVAIMNGTSLSEVFKGPKTSTFLSNILGTDRDNATVDVWATRVAFGETLPKSTYYSPKTDDYVSFYAPAASTYPIFNQAYKDATSQINQETGGEYNVAQIQAVTWLVYQKLSPPKSSELPNMSIDDIESHYAPQMVSAWFKGSEEDREDWSNQVKNSWWKNTMYVDEYGNIIPDKDEEEWAHLFDESESPRNNKQVDTNSADVEYLIDDKFDVEDIEFNDLYNEGREDAEEEASPRSERDFDDEQSFNAYLKGYYGVDTGWPVNSWWK